MGYKIIFSVSFFTTSVFSETTSPVDSDAILTQMFVS